MTSLLELIPGYREAVRLENQSRDLAFIIDRELICGIEVRSMTLKHFILLDGIASPFLYERIGDPSECAMFLWVLSPYWVSGQSKHRERLIKKCRKLNYGELVTEIL